MNHVCAVALRSTRLCLRSSPQQNLPNAVIDVLRRLTVSQQLCTTSLRPLPQLGAIFNAPLPGQIAARRQFSSQPAAQFQNSQIGRALGPLKPQVEAERGLAFGEKPLTADELQDVHGDAIPPPELANRLLRVIHGRRVDGTLDLPLPEDLEPLVEDFPYAFGASLEWLRDNYYVDEDEAIIARIDREESGYDDRTPSQLRQRAQDLKLYGPQSGKFDQERKEREIPGMPEYYGPQSGKYQAKLSEKGDVFGESQIEKIRERNEARSKQEEEELEQQIEEIQAKRVAQAQEERSQALATRPEQSIEVAEEEIRPPNEFEKWVLRAKNRAGSKLTLDSPEIMNKTLVSRLLPSFAFVLLFCTGCLLYSQYWQPPKRSDRLWPNMSLSFATIAGIMAVNTTIFVLWRFPPAWATLNRFFLVVPATPNPLSLFGNIFSHVQTKHFFFNMLPLLVFGPTLHEEMGRGNFIALYLASGVIGSFASLTHHAARGILYTSSLGASGSIWAVTGAFFNVYQQNEFTFFFMPDDWKEKGYIKGWMLFSCLIAIDIIGGLRGKPVTVDYVAHASGALSGWMLAAWFKANKTRSRGSDEYTPKSTLPWWRVILQKGENQDRGGS